ncbi:hypothetical protein [Paraburkholderia sp. J41]|uniref:hypothetical protein n=1 Tax=Paraburkholderia sp. J41 TaxID=2805433 RepID=UPI002AC36842|nr:hypothetical protein [Paraburkholderia sp. J41]
MARFDRRVLVGAFRSAHFDRRVLIDVFGGGLAALFFGTSSGALIDALISTLIATL